MRLRSGDKHHLRKSADRKAQIRKALVPLTGLICAFRSADFLRWCLFPERNLTHNLFFYFQQFLVLIWFIFSMRRRTVQPEIRSFVSVLQSPRPVTPFDRSKMKNANCFEDCNVFGNGKCELSAIQEGRNWGANFWQGKVQRCKFWQGKGKTHRQFQRY